MSWKTFFSGGQSEGLAKAKRPPHLTAEQTEAMLRPSAFRKQAGKHLESCERCHDEVESLREVLGDFRAASVLYAEKVQAGRGVARAVPARGGAGVSAPWRWSVAAGVLACALAGPSLLHVARGGGGAGSGAKPSAVKVAHGPQMSDEALLEDVQNDLTMSVPSPMQSLAVTSSSASGSTKSGAKTNGGSRGTANRNSE